MKIITSTAFEPHHEVTSHEVLTFFLDRAENRGGDSKGRRRERAEALEGVVSRLVGMLIEDGVLSPKQVCALFDYDVTAED